MKVQDVGVEVQKQAQLNLTGCLEFCEEETNQIGLIYLNDGLVYASKFNDFRGKHAFQHILKLQKPHVTVQYAQSVPDQEIDVPLDELMVEVIHAEFAGEELPEPTVIVKPPQTPALDPNLVFILFDKKGEWVVDTGRYIVGRGDTCHIVLDEPGVSTFHCVLDINGGRIQLHDYHSTNGTFKNGARVEDFVEVGPGDTIFLGDYSISIRTALRARHGKRVLVPYPVDMITMQRITEVETQKQEPVPVSVAKSQPLRFDADPDPNRKKTWTLPRIFK